MNDLHLLPKVRDSWSYLYLERCRIDQQDKGLVVHDERGRVHVPCAVLTTLLLGPGTTVTHAAMRTLAEAGCSVVWTGAEGVRLYAAGAGETRSSRNLTRQSLLHASPTLHQAVVLRMSHVRFAEQLDPHLSLRQIRGSEGVRVRDAYAKASRESGIPWRGRSYKRTSWGAGDIVNRALSVANSCLYGVVHAAIVSAGYSPGLGFVHTGKMLSFVYDIADLYKTEVSVPAAFAAAGEGEQDLEARIRRACRDAFHASRMLQRVVDDIGRVLDIGSSATEDSDAQDVLFDSDEGLPGGLWDPEAGQVEGGRSYGPDEVR